MSLIGCHYLNHRRKSNLKRWDAILRRIKDNDIIAEIGVWKGSNAKNILEGNKTVKIYCIDRWKKYTEDEAEREQATRMGDASRNKFKIAKNLANNNLIKIIHAFVSSYIQYPCQMDQYAQFP